MAGTANRRISKGGIATLFLFLTEIDRIPYFDIRYSLFDAYSPPEEDSIFAFSGFLFRLDWLLFKPAAELNL